MAVFVFVLPSLWIVFVLSVSHLWNRNETDTHTHTQTHEWPCKAFKSISSSLWGQCKPIFTSKCARFMSFEVIATGVQCSLHHWLNGNRHQKKRAASMHNTLKEGNKLPFDAVTTTKPAFIQPHTSSIVLDFRICFFDSIYSELMQQIPNKIRRLVTVKTNLRPLYEISGFSLRWHTAKTVLINRIRAPKHWNILEKLFKLVSIYMFALAAHARQPQIEIIICQKHAPLSVRSSRNATPLKSL